MTAKLKLLPPTQSVMMKISYPAIGLRLQWLRAKHSLSVSEAAARCEVSARSWARWERGSRMRTISALVICDEFKCSLDWFILGHRNAA